MEPQTREGLNEDTIANKVVGMMTDKRSFVWVTKKMTGSLELATLVACWASAKESKRLRRNWKMGR